MWTAASPPPRAGTYAVSLRAGLGILGNVFTEPALRRRGLGLRVTAIVVAALFEQGCGEVLLNVRVDNTAALAIYSRLGFETHCDFVETIGTAIATWGGGGTLRG